VFYGGALDIIRLSREHNDANVLSLGARFVDKDRAKEVVKLWLETKDNPAQKYTRRNHSMDTMVGRQKENAFSLVELSAILLMLSFFSAFVAASVSIARATSYFSG
jgi:hypothetical protein